MASASLRPRVWSVSVSSSATSCSRVGGGGGESRSSSAGPVGKPSLRRFCLAASWALWSASLAFFWSQCRSPGCFSSNVRQMPALGKTVQSANVNVPRLKEAMTVFPMSVMRMVIVGTAISDQTIKKGFPALLLGLRSP